MNLQPMLCKASSLSITVWRCNPLIRAIDAVYECGEIARRAEVPAALRSRLNLLNDEILKTAYRTYMRYCHPSCCKRDTYFPSETNGGHYFSELSTYTIEQNMAFKAVVRLHLSCHLIWCKLRVFFFHWCTWKIQYQFC